MGELGEEKYDSLLYVLILVLVEIGLGVLISPRYGNPLLGLNPCFSGNRFGRTRKQQTHKKRNLLVLILVLVEIGLGATASAASLVT